MKNNFDQGTQQTIFKNTWLHVVLIHFCSFQTTLPHMYLFIMLIRMPDKVNKQKSSNVRTNVTQAGRFCERPPRLCVIATAFIQSYKLRTTRHLTYSWLHVLVIWQLSCNTCLIIWIRKLGYWSTVFFSPLFLATWSHGAPNGDPTALSHAGLRNTLKSTLYNAKRGNTNTLSMGSSSHLMKELMLAMTIAQLSTASHVLPVYSM